MNLLTEINNFELNDIDSPIPFESDEAIENVLNNLDRAGVMGYNIWVGSSTIDAFIDEDELNNLTTTSNSFNRFENVNPKRSS